jgi:hypothetical protein
MHDGESRVGIVANFRFKALRVVRSMSGEGSGMKDPEQQPVC